jgi:hypothetical protein
MLIIIYLGFILLILGFFANYFLQRLEDHSQKIATLANIASTLVSDIQSTKQMSPPGPAPSSLPSSTPPSTPPTSNLTQEHFLISVSDDDDDDDDDGDDDDGDDDDDDDDDVDVDVVSSFRMVPLMDPIQILSMITGQQIKIEKQIEIEVLEESPDFVPENSPVVVQEEPSSPEKEPSFYRKLNVDQLRKLVTEKGLSSKVSKLKKAELIELLDNNNNNNNNNSDLD